MQTDILPTYQNSSQPFWQDRALKDVTDTVFIMKIFLHCYKIYSVRTFKWCMHKELKTSTASMICSPKQIVTLSNFLKIHRLFQHPETLIFQDLWGSAMYLVGRKTFVCLSIALVSKNMVFFNSMNFKYWGKTQKTWNIKSYHLSLQPISLFSNILERNTWLVPLWKTH